MVLLTLQRRHLRAETGRWDLLPAHRGGPDARRFDDPKALGEMVLLTLQRRHLRGEAGEYFLQRRRLLSVPHCRGDCGGPHLAPDSRGAEEEPSAERCEAHGYNGDVCDIRDGAVH